MSSDLYKWLHLSETNAGAENERLRIENAALKRALLAFMTQLGNSESDLAAAQESEGKLQDRVSFLEEIDRD